MRTHKFVFNILYESKMKGTIGDGMDKWLTLDSYMFNTVYLTELVYAFMKVRLCFNSSSNLSQSSRLIGVARSF